MKKIMKTLSLMFAVGAMLFGSGLHHEGAEVAKAEEETYSYTFSEKQWSANGDKTLNEVTWTLAGSGNYWGYDSTKGQQFGSSGNPYKSMTLSTSGIIGTINEITINTSGASSINASFTVSVGGTQYGSSTKLTTTATEYSFTGNSEGEIVFSYTQTSSKAIYIKSIEVTYEKGAAKTLSDITLNGSYKTAYKENETFDTTGLTVTATYSDGSTDDVTSKVTVVPSGALTTNDSVVTVTYNEGGVTKSKTINITVAARTLESISVKTNPSKMSYYPGETLDLTGLELTGTYNDDTTSDITSGWDAIDYTFTDEDCNNGSQTFTITYSGKKTTLTVSVVAAPAEATITFDDISKRTVLTTEQQVWEENGITVTNNKASSTTDVADYSKPARFYAKSDLIIEHIGKITQIEITASSSSYATALKNSITSGATVTVSDSVVTIILSTPSTSFTFSLGAQTRVSSIKIYYEENATKIYPTDFTLNSENIELEVGDTSNVKVDSYIGENINVKNVSWSTEDTEYISLNTQTGEFEALKEGNATITVSVQTGESTYKSKECNVKIKVGPNFKGEFSYNSVTDYKLSVGETAFYSFITDIDDKSTEEIEKVKIENDQKGVHIGTNNYPPQTVRFVGRFVSFASEGLKIKINASKTSSGNGKLKVYLGNTQVGEEFDLASEPTEYVFEADDTTAVSGYLTIEMNATEGAVYLKSIRVYGSMSDNNDAFCQFVNTIANAETCTDYVNIDSYKETYANLSGDDKTIFSYLTCEDKDYDWANNDKNTLLPVTVSLKDKLTYMEDYKAWKDAHPESGNLGSNLLTNLTSSNNTIFVLVVGLLGLISIAGYYFLNKKRYSC